ncbi:hypothetical protein FM019_20600 [Aliiglaciecola sp. M165]|nr:hypothetical protein FM019_20600 [Aliiglaciecola sp. M165]
MISRIIIVMIFLSISGCKSTSLAPKPEGWVELAFDIDKSGNPINISVVDSSKLGCINSLVIQMPLNPPNKPINRTNTRWLGSLRSQFSQQVFAVY